MNITTDTLHEHKHLLTEKEYEALHLHHVKGLSYRQISLGLDVSLTTIADRIRRGRHKLSRHLTERSNAA